MTADEIRRQSLEGVFEARTPKGYLLTESGYLTLVKSLTDDLAWKVQRDLVKGYFQSFPSKEFAKLEHSDFLKKVPEVLGEHAGNSSCMFDVSIGNGATRQSKGYRFPRREACLMAMSYSYELLAKVFDKNHRDVLRTIKRMMASQHAEIVAHAERNFALSSYVDSTGRSLPMYRMTADAPARRPAQGRGWCEAAAAVRLARAEADPGTDLRAGTVR